VSDYQVRVRFELPVDVDAVSIGGHADYLFTSMRSQKGG